MPRRRCAVTWGRPLRAAPPLPRSAGGSWNRLAAAPLPSSLFSPPPPVPPGIGRRLRPREERQAARAAPAWGSRERRSVRSVGVAAAAAAGDGRLVCEPEGGGLAPRRRESPEGRSEALRPRSGLRGGWAGPALGRHPVSAARRPAGRGTRWVWLLTCPPKALARWLPALCKRPGGGDTVWGWRWGRRRRLGSAR